MLGEEGSSDVRVPLSVIDGLMAEVAGALHDRPVQSLVAAKLMLESVRATPDATDNPFFDRGLKAVTDAGQLSRDVMWALTRMPPQLDDLESSIRDMFGRWAPEEGLTVEVDPGVSADQAELLLYAVHDVAAAVALRGGTIGSIVVHVAEGGLTCELVTTTPSPLPEDDPWLALARHRVAAEGGAVTRTGGAATTTVLTLPSALRDTTSD